MYIFSFSSISEKCAFLFKSNIIAILQHSERAGWEWTYIGVVDGEKALEREARSLILIGRRKYLDNCHCSSTVNTDQKQNQA